MRRIRESRKHGTLTVSVDPSLAATWLVARLDGFAKSHPEIDLRLDATNAIADFARDGVDAAIRYGTGEFPGLRADCLFADEVGPVCSPALVAGSSPLRLPDDLRRHNFIHLEWTPAKGSWPDWRTWLLAAGAGDIDVARGPRFTQHSLALQAAAQGQGVALASAALVADDVAAGRLVWPFELCLPTNFAYYLVCPAESADDPRIAAFRDWICAEARHASELADRPHS